MIQHPPTTRLHIKYIITATDVQRAASRRHTSITDVGRWRLQRSEGDNDTEGYKLSNQIGPIADSQARNNAAVLAWGG